MKKFLFFLCAFLPLVAGAQTFETRYERSVNDLMKDVARRFGVKFKFDSNVDTVGKRLPYADFRIRPYSLEMTLDNICKYYDWNWWKQSGNLYKIKLYEYPRRHEEEGKMMLDYLSSLYNNKAQWEARRDSLRREVRQRLELDAFLDSCVMKTAGKPAGTKERPVILSKIRWHHLCLAQEGQARSYRLSRRPLALSLSQGRTTTLRHLGSYGCRLRRFRPLWLGRE